MSAFVRPDEIAIYDVTDFGQEPQIIFTSQDGDEPWRNEVYTGEVREPWRNEVYTGEVREPWRNEVYTGEVREPWRNEVYTGTKI